MNEHTISENLSEETTTVNEAESLDNLDGFGARSSAGPDSSAQSVDSEAQEQTSQAHEAEINIPLAEAQAPAPSGNEWQDRYLRLMADFENYKRRSNREKDELLRLGNEKLLLAFLPLFDDMDRALSVAEKAESLDPVRDGLRLIHKQYRNILDKQGIRPIEAKGQPFDSQYHEAITSMPAPSPEQKDTILEEVRKGYLYHDKVIRYAQVITGE